MTMTDPSPPQRRIVSGARNAERILALGGLLAVAVVLARLLAGGQTLQVAAVSVPVGRMWIVLAALTAAHAFTARFLAMQIYEYLDRLPSPDRAGWVFDEITTGANAFVHGLVSRAVPRRRPVLGNPMSPHDPSAWVARGAGVLLLLAVLPWWWGESRLHWSGNGLLVALAIVLTLVNWRSGSRWLIALSRLDAVRGGARTRTRAAYTAGELARLMPPVQLTDDRYVLEEVVGVYRRLVDHPLPIRDTPDTPTDADRGFPGPSDTPVDSLTELHRAGISFKYVVVRESFPEADLPELPWFVTEEELLRHQSAGLPEPIRLRRPYKAPWWEISN
ncbi:hypothetical protein ACIQAC_28340 [Streptomyces sp. NPDC088387]|uniref:hypothetical protein n=1 Tax=Streptomyces sp. NPDC088387 TaxID=3365859 RepID=UPI00380C7B83